MLRSRAAHTCGPHVPGPPRFAAPLLLPLQQLLEGAAASGRVRAPRPLLLLLGLGPVAGYPRDFHQLAFKLLQPAALLIALSRMVLGYLQPKQYPEIHGLVEGALKKLDVPVTALFSTLGRTAARAIESSLAARWALEDYQKLLANIKAGDTRTIRFNFSEDPGSSFTNGDLVEIGRAHV